MLRLQRELADQKREIELTIEKRVQQNLDNTRAQARKEAEESLSLKVREKEETITSMQRQIEDLKRRAEQGSQQLQGEVLELELENILKAKFSNDKIEPVPKGEHGGDILQHVVNPAGVECGVIIWETKRTKNWSDVWLAKLRDDQRAAKADLSVIVSQTLPKEVESFDCISGVWVTEPRLALPIAIALRQSLIDVTLARKTSEGQQSKMALIYEYLTGSQFKHRIEVETIIQKRGKAIIQSARDHIKRGDAKNWQ